MVVSRNVYMSASRNVYMDALGNIYDSEHMSIKWIPKVRLYAAPSA